MLTEPLFFDTDCLSAFLWVKRQSLLAQLYPGRIVIPMQVYRELSYPGIPHLKARIDFMIESRKAMVGSFDVGSPEHSLYVKLTQSGFALSSALGSQDGEQDEGQHGLHG